MTAVERTSPVVGLDSTVVEPDGSPLRHLRPGAAPWLRPSGRWALARQRILVLDGPRQRRVARRWGTAWSHHHPSGVEGWLLLIPDTSSPHQCRVELLHPGRESRGPRPELGGTADDHGLAAAPRVPGPTDRPGFMVLRVGQDQLRIRRVGFPQLQQDTEAIETMILRLQAALCPGLPVVVEGLFDQASLLWFEGLAGQHPDWWLSWRPGGTTGHALRMVRDTGDIPLRAPAPHSAARPPRPSGRPHLPPRGG